MAQMVACRTIEEIEVIPSALCRRNHCPFHAKVAKEKEGAKVSADVEELARIVVDCGIALHRDVGPGLLESAYETVLCHRLAQRGITTERQKLIPIVIDGIVIEQGFRADVIVQQTLLLELKSVDRLLPVHGKQLLTYLRFLDLRVGLLMNFGGETLKEGLKRVINNYAP
jgi:GxxExxY protein